MPVFSPLGAAPAAPPAFTLRVFLPEDAAALIQLWQRCGLTRPWNDPAQDIARKLADSPELLAVLTLAAPGQGAGALVGSVMAGYDGHRGWINYLAVAPEYQRQGAGRQLMAWAQAQLQARGCAKINLQVRRGNAQVLDFYRALGFVPDDLLSLGLRLVADAPGAKS